MSCEKWVETKFNPVTEPKLHTKNERSRPLLLYNASETTKERFILSMVSVSSSSHSSSSSEQVSTRRRAPQQRRVMVIFSSSEGESDHDDAITSQPAEQQNIGSGLGSQETFLATQSQAPLIAKKQTSQRKKERAVHGKPTFSGIPTVILAGETLGSVTMESITQTSPVSIKADKRSTEELDTLMDLTTDLETWNASKPTSAARVSLSPQKNGILCISKAPRKSSSQTISTLEAIGTKPIQSITSEMTNKDINMTEGALQENEESKKGTLLQTITEVVKIADKPPKSKSAAKRTSDSLVTDLEEAQMSQSKRRKKKEESDESTVNSSTREARRQSSQTTTRETPREKTDETVAEPATRKARKQSLNMTTMETANANAVEKMKKTTGTTKNSSKPVQASSSKELQHAANPTLKEVTKGSTATKKKRSDDASKETIDETESVALVKKVVEKTTSTNDIDSPEKPKKKMKTFQSQVLTEMFLSCRPYTLKTLSQALQTTESALHHVMLTLLDKHIVIKKEFSSGNGRSKELYWANQDSKAKEIQGLLVSPEEIGAVRDQLQNVQRYEMEIQKQMTVMTQELSNDDLNRQVQEMERSLAALKESFLEVQCRIKAAKLQSKTTVRVNKTPAQLAKERCPRRLKLRINHIRDEWKKRKEKCMDFIEQLADGMEKKPKDVFKLLCLETDEMEGAVMPAKYVIE